LQKFVVSLEHGNAISQQFFMAHDDDLSVIDWKNVFEAFCGQDDAAADAGRLFGLHRSNITRLLERSKLTDKNL
jgi:hypothetical protein